VTFSVAPRAIVVDASAAIELLLGREEWLGRWRAWTEAGDLLVVPAHFGHEVANALLLGMRLPARAAAAAVERLFATGLEVVDRGVAGLAASVHLAADHSLTAFDAGYLDLAIELDGELATLDRALRKAAAREAIALVG
jgi:predicted nucleic acid-binding protein